MGLSGGMDVVGVTAQGVGSDDDATGVADAALGGAEGGLALTGGEKRLSTSSAGVAAPL
jgi:hypothetical protein